ncbi:MAG: hypothetical protein NC905_03830 [Candidatus Omnitrophica bacterium]|nr:hypothetical protein [Candidatus Omnitrophota bacterium]
MRQIIKEGFSLKGKEFLLSVIVFFYLILSFSVLSFYNSSNYLPYIQLFFLLLENYITVSVYYGIRQSLWEGIFDISAIFIKGRQLFFRALGYKLLAGAFIILVFAFCLSMVELVKDSSLITVGFITGFTILWLVFPVYLFLLTVLTPLVIIADDVPLFKGVRISMGFIRGHLADTGKLILLLLPLWAFVIYLLKLYNEKVPFLQIFIFYLVSLLEIITVKVFLLFYRDREVR